MKKKVLIGFMMVTSLFLTGCTSGKEIVTKCELNNNSSSVYSIKATYNIYSKNNIVTKVVTKEEATSENKDVLDTLESTLNSTYKKASKSYGGYKYDVKRDDNKVTSNVTIDYTKMDMNKFIKENTALKSYANKNNKLTKEGVKKIYTSMGATCEK